MNMDNIKSVHVLYKPGYESFYSVEVKIKLGKMTWLADFRFHGDAFDWAQGVADAHGVQLMDDSR